MKTVSEFFDSMGTKPVSDFFESIESGAERPINDVPMPAERYQPDAAAIAKRKAWENRPNVSRAPMGLSSADWSSLSKSFSAGRAALDKGRRFK